MEEKIKYIQSRLSREEMLCQLAEECCELGKASLKLCRVLTGTNPTPVSYDEAVENLIEEYADIFLVLDVLDFFTLENLNKVGTIGREKCERWEKRLRESADE